MFLEFINAKIEKIYSIKRCLYRW